MKIAFLSCMDAVRVRNPAVWDEIRQSVRPDVLILMGDQIYMDWGALHPNWPKVVGTPEGQKAYAEDMYRRYRAQWSLVSFQKLLLSLPSRDARHLLVTWDDHDFAWNNALGGDSTGDKACGVPDTVRAISLALFQQFVHMCRTLVAPGASMYPPLPDMGTLLGTELGAYPSGVFSEVVLAGEGPTCLLLDTRWARQSRLSHQAGRRLLDDAQRDTLLAHAEKQGSGLLVVVGGTPLWHRYLARHEAWGPGSGHWQGIEAYQEYAQFLCAAKRPILFLAGDVHQNHYTGRLNLQDSAEPSQVVQLVSSGAAIGHFGPRRFDPSYGVIEVPATWQSGGEVGVRLCEQTKTGDWKDSVVVAPMRFDADQWLGALQGAAATQDVPLDDGEPVALWLARPRQQAHKSESTLGPAPSEELDGFFQTAPVMDGELAEPMLATAEDLAGTLRWTLHSYGLSNGQRSEGARTLLTQAFERARKNKRAVVLFVHGFGKSVPEALAQAYDLRRMYGVEPVLFSWFAGADGGLLKTVQGVNAAVDNAYSQRGALRAALDLCNTLAAIHDDVPALVVARSAGALALHSALVDWMPNQPDKLAHMRRVVLSAPLMSQKAFEHPLGLAGLGMEVAVTRNKNDRTLGYARYMGKTLYASMGLDAPFYPATPQQFCFDFTACPNIADLHDYIFIEAHAAQLAVHGALLGGDPIDTAALKALHAVRADTAAGVWLVGP